MELIERRIEKVINPHSLVFLIQRDCRQETDFSIDFLLFLLRYSFILTDTPQDNYFSKRHFSPPGDISTQNSNGSRYLDPKYSRWISTDPALGEYVPAAPVDDEAKKHNQNLPGMGGLFNTVNLSLYHYAGNNPVKYTDPDGRDIILLNRSWGANFPLGPYGHNAVLIGNDKNGWMYYSKDGLLTNNAIRFNTLQDFIDYNNSLDTPVKLSYDRACRVKTEEKDDKKAYIIANIIIHRFYNFIETKDKNGYTTSQNCSDLTADIISTYGIFDIQKIKIKKTIGSIDLNEDERLDFIVETKITWPNAQFFSFVYKNKATMIDIYDEDMVEIRKQHQFDQIMHQSHIY